MPLMPAPAPPKDPARDMSIEAVIKKACDTLLAAEPELNELDGKVGDGDCGSTMKIGAEAIMAVLGKVSTANPKATLAAFGRQLSSLGGSSGVLLSIMFTMAGVLTDDAGWSRAGLGPAFAEGVATIMRVGGARLGMRTMVDVLHPVSEAMVSGAEADMISTIAQERADASALVDSTDCGRSQYLNSTSLKGIKDPGCVAAAMVIRALAS